MTTSSVEQGTTRPRSATNLLIMGGVIVLLVALFFLAQASRSVSLNRSATGFDGLPRWLTTNEIPARTFYGRAVLDIESVGLRILPLFDVDLRQSLQKTNDDEAVMAETDRDISHYVVRRKMALLPTLLVMPKWRAGVRDVAALHPDLLIADDSADTVTSQVGFDIGRLVRDKEAVDSTGKTPSGAEYLLHYPQTLENSPCVPIIGTAQAMVLGRCEAVDTPFWVLADPDLLNNHGLSQGDNAAAALEWLPSLTGDTGEEIILDLTTAIWSYRRGVRATQQRSWSDLSRFFEYPFSIIWWSFGCLGALVFWRAWRRYGAADARSEEEKGPRASRLVSMDTKARLLRLTGRDDALVHTYINGRLDHLADEILGPHRTRRPDDRDRLFAAINRRAPELGQQFTVFGVQPFDTATSPDILLRSVAHLDDLIERTLDEFGRTGRIG